MAPPPTPSGTLPPVIGAEQAAAAFPPLLVAAERVAATVAQGIHGRRRTGPGDSFWQFRRYQAGDPAQAIDWRQTAKADRPYVREHEWESAQTVRLWCAGGPGMDWRSAPALPTKRERAVLLVLALASLLLRGGERVGLLLDGDRPTSGRLALHRLAGTLERMGADGGSWDMPGAGLPRHTAVVLVGDFLEPVEDIAGRLRRLAGHGARGHLVQVLDPAEESLPYSGRIQFTEPARGVIAAPAHWLVNRAEDIRGAYAERLLAHREAVRALARSLGWTFALHHTDTPPESALLGLHQTLSGALLRGGGG